MVNKMKLKKNIKVILIIIILGIIIYCGYIIYNNNYSEVNKIMKQENIGKENYSKTLEYVLLNNIYDEKYLEEYKDIEYNNNPNFQEILTTFLPLGYSGKEINYIFKLSNKNIKYLKEMDYIDISNYYKVSNFDIRKINRYEEYKSNNDNYSYEDIVTYVNINLDKEAYTDTLEVSDPDNILVLVNKYNYLPSNYEPNDITYLEGAYGNNVPIRSIIKESFLALQSAIKKEKNVTLMPTTAFRNESFQKTLYNQYVEKDGIEAADLYSARPGYSEHQTGLAIDLKNVALGSNTRLTDDDYKWLEENAHKYGFIIRFPQDKEFITGYQFENWHIRYVGIDNATIIYENDLSLEEYIDLYITEY